MKIAFDGMRFAGKTTISHKLFLECEKALGRDKVKMLRLPILDEESVYGKMMRQYQDHSWFLQGAISYSTGPQIPGKDICLASRLVEHALFQAQLNEKRDYIESLAKDRVCIIDGFWIARLYNVLDESHVDVEKLCYDYIIPEVLVFMQISAKESLFRSLKKVNKYQEEFKEMQDVNARIISTYKKILKCSALRKTEKIILNVEAGESPENTFKSLLEMIGPIKSLEL